MTYNIEGKNVGLIFGYTGYKRFIKSVSTNRSLYYDASGEFTDEAFVEIIFCAYENWCFEQRALVELSRDQVARWIDEQYKTEEGKEMINGLFQAWKDSNDVSKLIDEAQKKTNGSLTSTS
jgi:hypothetical protein